MDVFKIGEFTTWAAAERAERSEGEQGLHPADKVRAFLAVLDDAVHRRAIRQRLSEDVFYRWSTRQQFLARLEAI